ncbi:MAG TPA: ATP-binding protein, partial [Lacipirellulaceae bacterium]|nr:ATP-binding protein [Lacipirellulaceae bacterium]
LARMKAHLAELNAQGIEVSVDVPPNTAIAADREMLRRAILNLVLNAVDAMPLGGELTITSYHGRAGFELEIADSGPGLVPEQMQRVFEPFFTTKSSGTGLGLSIVQRIAEAHGGRVTALNCPQGGAAFTIQFPFRRAIGVAA